MSLETAADELPDAGSSPTPRRHRWRTAYRVLATLFLLGVVVQVLFAGLAAFDLPELWSWHTRWVQVVEGTALLMLLVALIARLRGVRWLSAVILLMVMLQHGSAALGGLAGGFHTVNALVILMLGRAAARRAGSPIQP